MVTLYHKNLPIGQNIIEVPDDEGTLRILKESGWSKQVPKARKEDDPANVAGDQGGK